jgi:hypothetical protein
MASPPTLRSNPRWNHLCAATSIFLALLFKIGFVDVAVAEKPGFGPPLPLLDRAASRFASTMIST